LSHTNGLGFLFLFWGKKTFQCLTGTLWSQWRFNCCPTATWHRAKIWTKKRTNIKCNEKTGDSNCSDKV